MSRLSTKTKHKLHWKDAWETIETDSFDARVRCCGKVHTLRLLKTGELIPLNHNGWNDDVDRVLVYSGEDMRCHKVLNTWREIFKNGHLSTECKAILPKGKVNGWRLQDIANTLLHNSNAWRNEWSRVQRARRASVKTAVDRYTYKNQWVSRLWNNYLQWVLDSQFYANELSGVLDRPHHSQRGASTEIAEKNAANFICAVVKKGMLKNTYLRVNTQVIPPPAGASRLQRVAVRNVVQMDDRLVCIYYRLKRDAYNPSYGGNSFSSTPFIGVAELGSDGSWIIKDFNYGVY